VSDSLRSISKRPELCLLGVIGATVTTVSISSLSALAALSGIGSLLVLRAPSGGRLLLRRLRSLAPLAVIAGLLRGSQVHGATPIAIFGLQLTAEAAHAGALVTLRILIATLFATWLSASLSPAELEQALAKLKVPEALVELLSLTRRFASQLRSTLSSAWISVALRGGFLSQRRLGRTLGLVAGVVVVRALDRSQRVGTALALRGHGYGQHIASNESTPSEAATRTTSVADV